MPSLGVIAVFAGVALTLLIFFIWFAHSRGYKEGEDDANAAVQKKRTDAAEIAGAIVAEQRDDTDTAKRLRDGTL